MSTLKQVLACFSSQQTSRLPCLLLGMENRLLVVGASLPEFKLNHHCSSISNIWTNLRCLTTLSPPWPWGQTIVFTIRAMSRILWRPSHRHCLCLCPVTIWIRNTSGWILDVRWSDKRVTFNAPTEHASSTVSPRTHGCRNSTAAMMQSVVPEYVHCRYQGNNDPRKIIVMRIINCWTWWQGWPADTSAVAGSEES